MLGIWIILDSLRGSFEKRRGARRLGCQARQTPAFLPFSPPPGLFTRYFSSLTDASLWAALAGGIRDAEPSLAAVLLGRPHQFCSNPRSSRLMFSPPRQRRFHKRRGPLRAKGKRVRGEDPIRLTGSLPPVITCLSEGNHRSHFFSTRAVTPLEVTQV